MDERLTAQAVGQRRKGIKSSCLLCRDNLHLVANPPHHKLNMIDHKYCRGQSIFAAATELDAEFMLFSAARYRPLCYYRFWFKCSFPGQGATDASLPHPGPFH